MIPVLNTSPLFKPEGEPLEILEAAGCAVVINLYHPGRTAEEMLALLEEVRPHGAIAGLDPFNATVIAAGARTGLRVIARTGVGYDTIDGEAATAHGGGGCPTLGSNH